MSMGVGSWGWFPRPYSALYWGRCRWFPWLPRWWWTGIYGPITPFVLPKEQERAMLTEQAKALEKALGEIKERLDELKKLGEEN